MTFHQVLPIVLGLLVVALLVFFVLRQKRKTRILQVEGVGTIVQVKQLITSIQQHRGWCSAYLRGDASVIGDIQQLQRKIAQTTLAIENEHPIKSYERWFSYTEHWKRLSGSATTLTADNSFKQHTQLIGNMLYLLEDIAESHFLTAEQLGEFPDISLLWRELLQVSECVGQSRALGTGVATVKECNRVEKIRLGFLRQKITETAEITYAQLKENHSGHNQHKLQSLIEHASKQTRYLCSVIEHELVECEQIQLDAKNYFSLATEAINSLNQIFDFKLAELEQFLTHK
ncbi:hypothetical protein DS2_05855 [Catenovulum agarivorans DS-2]|uniref:Nitrate/nitrite sensing protein domain-containing protein n=1 Tax=Catenovulum agarivorans DS-2 TaxID=1328313 RepID=W7QDU7_9ALTE|nr:nitrate- and nitrite sensing domain-containing protein [Catenovulum agarivorans]EWH11069.1 hypothetical protein DS2_05855 [Catenovulum agarivorans DS-2]